jgi:ABC-type lipoprotein release transport system permease subunit
MPLLAEAMLLSVIGFLLGLALAYLVELHRRASAGRRW